MEQRNIRNCRWMAVLFTVLVLLSGCDSREKYVGVYRALGQSAQGQREVVLELREHGDGVWKVATDRSGTKFSEAPCTWYIKRGELRINTKTGGVIIGRIDKDVIRISLPDFNTLVFKKTG
jgi:hypothetical protein